ncbi:TonB-dependent receptor [Roseomonas aeriglobus]|nr:TonB-dependent receptor [Roseomonas aeriglobus]
MRRVWPAALAASALPALPAAARDAEYRVNLPPGDLSDALATLSAQTGASVATDPGLPRIAARRVSGRMPIRRALERLVDGAPVRVVQVGPTVFRLVRRRAAELADPPTVPPDIVVTARKQSEALSGVAAPVSIYVPDDAAASGAARSAHDVAARVDGLTLTSLGPGRDRPFIRGVADSPFNGFSQSTVSVQLDDARITYDAAEPGLRLVDIARVELLKGPQGPLYGTGALGGVYRIVTNRPVLGAVEGTARFGVSAIGGGGPGGEAEGVLNLPLASDAAAVRLVGYAALDGGWIDDTGGRRNINQSQTLGARAALRVAPAAGWTVDVGGAAQQIATRDSQYVDRRGEEIGRSLPIREPRDTRLRLVHGTVSGPIGTPILTIATAHSWQDQNDIYDASTRPAGAARAYRDRRSYRVFDQEVRLSSGDGTAFSWLVGASYLAATTQASGDLQAVSLVSAPIFRLHRRVTEAAAFADGALPLTRRLRASLGARLFRTTTEDELEEEAGGIAATTKAIVGITPSASLSYEIVSGRVVYARFGTAFRPGGIDPSNTESGRYDADEMRSFDLGMRLSLDRGRLAIDGGLFRSIWKYVQSDYLLPDGLIATRNAGDADIVGAELAIDWWRGAWRLRTGVTLQRPRLTRAPDGADLPEDRRLPVVPDAAGRIELSRAFRLGGTRLLPFIAINLQGASRLSFDDGLDRRLGGFAIARAGATLTRGPLVGRLDIDNLLDTRAASFAFGNPFSVRDARQYTPARPRTLSVSLSRAF